MVGRLMGPVGSGIGEGGRGRVMPVRVVLDAGVGRTREIRQPPSWHWGPPSSNRKIKRASQRRADGKTLILVNFATAQIPPST